jgi:hypothetical protein
LISALDAKRLRLFADSADHAHLFQHDGAQRSDMIVRSIPI